MLIIQPKNTENGRFIGVKIGMKGTDRLKDILPDGMCSVDFPDQLGYIIGQIGDAYAYVYGGSYSIWPRVVPREKIGQKGAILPLGGFRVDQIIMEYVIIIFLKIMITINVIG